MVDHQVGLFQIVRDFAPDQFRNNILAHAQLGVVFGLPTILTTSAESGAQCLMLGELTNSASRLTYL